MKVVECSFYITNFYYKFSNINKWNREAGRLLTKISIVVEFKNKKHLLQCKVKYNDKTLKIYDH